MEETRIVPVDAAACRAYRDLTEDRCRLHPASSPGGGTASFLVLNDKLQTRKPDSSGLGSCLSSSSLVVFFIRIRQRQKPCPVSRKPPLPAYLLSLVLDLGLRSSFDPA